tara:strand:- start:303 stop:1322 length:1020 start_codon:yes stop_codon:yes gene_type:complete
MIQEDILQVINEYTKYTHDTSINKELIIEELSFLFSDDIDMISENINYFYDFINTKRQCSWSFYKIQNNAEKLINIVENKEQPDQRTDEWYKYRYNMLTASSMWKIFKSDSTRKELIKNKKEPLDLNKYKNVNTESPLHWGHKYEPISVLFYENMFDTKVGDFGCIKHTKYPHIGASPDGINIKKNHNLYGRMLEIKNIVNRTLSGIPKCEYWIQMQIQMEVCDLDYCDFLECKFTEYNTYEDYMNDGTFNETRNFMQKGIIVQLFNGVEPVYFYKPFNMSPEDFENWKNNIIDNNLDCSWIRDIYWHLEEYSCILVERNNEWFRQSVDEINFIWSKII